jgi:hypothetical protein
VIIAVTTDRKKPVQCLAAVAGRANNLLQCLIKVVSWIIIPQRRLDIHSKIPVIDISIFIYMGINTQSSDGLLPHFEKRRSAQNRVER